MIKQIEEIDRRILYWILSKKTDKNCILVIHFLIGFFGSLFIAFRVMYLFIINLIKGKL